MMHNICVYACLCLCVCVYVCVFGCVLSWPAQLQRLLILPVPRHFDHKRIWLPASRKDTYTHAHTHARTHTHAPVGWLPTFLFDQRVLQPAAQMSPHLWRGLLAFRLQKKVWGFLLCSLSKEGMAHLHVCMHKLRLPSGVISDHLAGRTMSSLRLPFGVSVRVWLCTCVRTWVSVFVFVRVFVWAVCR